MDGFCTSEKRGTDTVRSPDVENMGEEFGLGTKPFPQKRRRKSTITIVYAEN